MDEAGPLTGSFRGAAQAASGTTCLRSSGVAHPCTAPANAGWKLGVFLKVWALLAGR